MADSGNYSFSSHNLRSPVMRQSFNRPAVLVQNSKLQSPENRFGLSPKKASESQGDKPFTTMDGDTQRVRFAPHPPSSPRSNAPDSNVHRVAALNSNGVKRSRHESPRNSPSGSEDERRIHQQVNNAILDPLPMRRGSTRSLNSMGSSESLGSPRQRNRNLRGVEPLGDIVSDKDITGNFKSYQNRAKNDESGRKILKNVVHPMRVTHDQTAEGEKNVQETLPVKVNSEQSVSLNNKTPSEDEVTLSSSDDSLTSVSDSEEDLVSDSDISRNKKLELGKQRDPISTLPTLPGQLNDRNLASNSTGLYESIHPQKVDNVQNNSTSDLRNLSKELEKVATNDERYGSDTDLSVRSTGQASNLSTMSMLPRVSARTARTRSGNFLKEEMERYLPDHQIGVFVATWNMHEEKVSCMFKQVPVTCHRHDYLI